MDRSCGPRCVIRHVFRCAYFGVTRVDSHALFVRDVSNDQAPKRDSELQRDADERTDGQRYSDQVSDFCGRMKVSVTEGRREYGDETRRESGGIGNL